MTITAASPSAARGVALLVVGLAAAVSACEGPVEPRCSTTAALAEAESAAPRPPITLVVEAVSTSTVWVTRSDKCASPVFERLDGDTWTPLRTVARFRCPDGAGPCPGPIPTAVERVPVGPTPRALATWRGDYLLPRDETCDEDDVPAQTFSGRYRVTVPYCTDPAACDALPMIALPSAAACPHTRTATAIVDVVEERATVLVPLTP